MIHTISPLVKPLPRFDLKDLVKHDLVARTDIERGSLLITISSGCSLDSLPQDHIGCCHKAPREIPEEMLKTGLGGLTMRHLII
jgi:hypothetical protein